MTNKPPKLVKKSETPSLAKELVERPVLARAEVRSNVNKRMVSASNAVAKAAPGATLKAFPQPNGIRVIVTVPPWQMGKATAAYKNAVGA